jgi:hypothetical protein
LRQRLFAATLRQEVEYVERSEGDAISRLSVDSSIVGERYGCLPKNKETVRLLNA